MKVTIYIGPPGCGKTTKLGELVTEAVDQGRTPMVCSLTKTAAQEVSSRGLDLPAENIGTLHSHAFAALSRPKVVEGQLDGWNAAQPVYALSGGMSRDADDLSSDIRSGTTIGDELLSELDLLRARMVDPELWPASVRHFSRIWQDWKDNTNLIDFTDMIDLARSTSRANCSPDIMFVDEAQDMSRLELALLRRWATSAGELVIVGDPYQALFTWRGAAPEMFFSDKVAEENRHVLSQSYRVPKAVHAVAMAWLESETLDYKPIEYHPTPEEGFVDWIDAAYTSPEDFMRVIREHLTEGETVMVCATCGYMLRNFIKVLRDEGIPFSNPWRTKRGDWNPLSPGRGVRMIDRLAAFLKPAFGNKWTSHDVCLWSEPLKSKDLMARGAKKDLKNMTADPESAVVEYTEHECWQHFSDTLVPLMLKGTVCKQSMLNWYRSRVLADKADRMEFPIRIAEVAEDEFEMLSQPSVHVGTIHSFKGAEADIVILFPDVSVRGMDSWEEGGDAHDEVVRTMYVGLTRAKRGLYVAEPVSGRSVPVGSYVAEGVGL